MKFFSFKYLFFLLLTFSVSIFNSCKESSSNNKNDNSLPILGRKEFNPDTQDSTHHKIEEFAFINQDSNLITLDSLKGKVTIVNFFFTSCPSICPVMVRQLKRFQNEIEGKYSVQILTHTVDPQRDTVGKLQAFIKKNDINTHNWDFVTGKKPKLYESGVFNYYLATEEDALAPGGFLHSEKFVLVDKNLHIRGYYNGTEEEEVNQLIKDLKLLFDE